MILNNWYVAAESAEVAEKPVPVRMLGCDFVLFRTPAGEVACLSAVCCHRGGDLASGRRVGECVQCPYHGWEFDRTGQCTRMPPLGDDVRVPARARVDAYPTEERWGYIWAFLGDMGEAERPALPDFLPQYGREEEWRVVRMQRDWQANWARIHENLLDTSHLYLVHSFGRHLPARMTIWPAERLPWGGRVVQRFGVTPNRASKTAVNEPEAPRARPESLVTLDFSLIGLMHKNTQQMSSGYDQVIWNCLTPVDAYRTRNFGLHFRNFQREPKHDEAMKKTILNGLDEDAVVIERIRPRLRPPTPDHELWMATDAVERLYRDQAREHADRLGEIDVGRCEALSRDRVLVIPSPGRRGSAGGWVHDTVPLIGQGHPC
jgi:phenylpropionate dioxygenase-like ring-hydroxylating dioxygenase large terminal subunit